MALGNAVNADSIGVTTISSSGGWSGSVISQYNVAIGNGSNTITGVAPSSTSGVPLISQGSSSNPAFGTAVVGGGGTGGTSFTAYTLICAGTTTTGAFQNVASVGTSNQVLTSNGASALPSFQAVSASGAITTIDGDSGSCTPSSGVVTISGGSTGLTTSGSSHTLSLTGTLVVGNGGTGAATLTGLLVGNGTSAVTATAITQYNVLTGGASNAPNSVAPSSTSGIPLVSNGSSSQPSFTTAVVAGGGTGLTTTTAYGVICGGTTATGNFQNAGAGSSGQILKSNGASSLPTWVATSTVGGSLVKLSTQTASSSASIAFTQFSATYTTYLLVWGNHQPATNAASLYMQVSANGGSSYLSTGYQNGTTFVAYNSATWSNVNSTTYGTLSAGCDNNQVGSGYAWINNIGTSSNFNCNATSQTVSSSVTYNCQCTTFNSSTSVNAIQIYESSGNIATGTFTLYGLLQ